MVFVELVAEGNKMLFVELLPGGNNLHTLKYLICDSYGTDYWSSKIALFMYFRLNIESRCPR